MSSLARDDLAVWGASCAVDRTFSAEEDVCCHDQGAVKPAAVEHLVGSQMWVKDGVVIAGEEFEACQQSMAESVTLYQ